MTGVLVTGMSGTGKSTVLVELGRRGHRVVDTDHSGWGREVTAPRGGLERLWREDRCRRSSPGRCQPGAQHARRDPRAVSRPGRDSERVGGRTSVRLFGEMPLATLVAAASDAAMRLAREVLGSLLE